MTEDNDLFVLSFMSVLLKRFEQSSDMGGETICSTTTAVDIETLVMSRNDCRPATGVLLPNTVQ